MFLSKMLKRSIIILILAVSLGSAGNRTPDANDTNQSTVTKVGKKTYHVENVEQNYESVINKMLKEQIEVELKASLIYMAYASYFQRADVNLPGIQKFFADAGAEEKQHAQMLIDLVNKRGGHVYLDTINLFETCKKVKRNKNDKANVERYFEDDDKKARMCICSFVSAKEIFPECPTSRTEWKDGLYAFTDALAVERYVNEELLKLHEKAASDEVRDVQLAHYLEHEFLEEQVKSIYQLGNYVKRLKSFKGDNYHLGEYLFDQELK